jgi:hypothetical protein
MTERTHDCLDGQISADELTEDEHLHLEELEAVIRESVAHVLEEPCPDVVPAVLERIRELEALTFEGRDSRSTLIRAVETASRWMWTPRLVRLRPALVLAALAVVAVGLGISTNRMGIPLSPEGAIATQQTTGTVLLVRFELEAAGVTSVSLAGTFSDWQPRYELTETAPGHWTALVPLQPGVHDYSFVVNGEQWVADPHAPRVDDGFGGINSRIALVGPQNRDSERSL